jgi:hypothetical protein
MRCTSCNVHLTYLGTDRDGQQYFECRHDGCDRQHKPLCRWWESGTDFQLESVE